ncbi:PREDICTED: golgin subfamily A member 8M-like [Mandrillus leucophaeus]|uniref:golgin subfamily A member 8M-like n=1 Tax=Mandrillus leucophaeus TaxID=9568 RepID=UPI0005F3A1EA|nr:PREDICTED: golgin subfamily A member 8M-like [Mandrillus leucophaeus]
MWPQTRLPPHPAMAEETQQSKLAAAKKKLKEYWQRNSPGVPARAKRNRKTNGSVPETATSGGCHLPGDSATGIGREGPTSSVPLKDLESPSQELAAALDLRSVKISQLKNTIKSLKQQKKQVEHQLEEEKKANNEKQKAERELEVQIQTLNVQKGKLSTDLFRTKRSLRYFEEESKDLADRLQCSLQRKGELEQVLCAVTATQKKKANLSSSHRKACMEWKLEWSTREQALLKAQLTQLKESLREAHLERDEYVEHLKGERARWQHRMKKMSQEVCTLKKEKKDDMRRVEKLERSLCKVKNQMAKPQHPEPPAVPPEEELQHLRKELERVSAELQAHVENHQHVSPLNQPQKERLGRQEERLQQLVEPHRGVEELVELKSQKAQSLQQQPDHYLGHLQQSVAIYQQQVAAYHQLTSEKEALHRQLLQQTQLMNQLQQQEAWGKAEHLEAARQQNQQLQDQLSLMALPGEGDGGHLDSEEEEGPRPMPSVPEDLESWEVMSSLMDLLEEKTDLRERVEKLEVQFIQYWRKRCHQKIRHLINEPGGSVKDAARGGHIQAGPGQGGDEGEAAGAAGDGVAALHKRALAGILLNVRSKDHKKSFTSLNVPGTGIQALVKNELQESRVTPGILLFTELL